jgi:hypothetical protein
LGFRESVPLLEVDEAKFVGGGGRVEKGLWNFREGPWELYSSKGPFANFIPPLLGLLETTRVT